MAGGCKKDDESKEAGKAAAEMVVVTKEGTKLDPAVPKSRIPDGAWMCDMGTVHFVKTEKGTCDLCGMPLTLKGAAAEPAATDPAAEPAAKDPAAEPAAVSPTEARDSLKKLSDSARLYYQDGGSAK
tara:strand:- start:120045 stop:120425 length:381 start_codon:yes stop_codon:yes gene_type:complete